MVLLFGVVLSASESALLVEVLLILVVALVACQIATVAFVSRRTRALTRTLGALVEGSAQVRAEPVRHTQVEQLSRVIAQHTALRPSLTPSLIPTREITFDPDAEYGDGSPSLQQLPYPPAPRGAGQPSVDQKEFMSIEEMAVTAVIDGGRPLAQVAQTYRVSTSLVAYWVAKSKRSRNPRPRPATS